MSSIWSNSAAQTGTTSLTTAGVAPGPGGGAAAKFQSILQAAGKTGPGSPSSLSARSSATADSTTGSSSTSDSDTTISANDFLTLLVTEMQNQDPTADTDPNAYINQLVQINSLEQLISINQNLSTVLGAASTTSGETGTSNSAASVPAISGSNAKAQAARASAASLYTKPNAASSAMGTGVASPNSSDVRSSSVAKPSRTVHGNLSAPADLPAPHVVARALDGHARATPRGPAIRDIPTRALP